MARLNCMQAVRRWFGNVPAPSPCAARRQRPGVRPELEPLEDRNLLSAYGLNVLSTTQGVVPAGGVATHAIILDPSQYAFSKHGDLALQFVLRPTEGSTLLAAPVAVLDANGRPVRPHLESTKTADSGGSVAVVSLAPGQYRLVLDGRADTSGSYELVASLTGDVDGDRRVDDEDTILARALLNTSRTDAAYRRSADADLDGRITGQDHSLLVRHQGAAATQLSALSFTVDLALAPTVRELPRLNPTDPAPRSLSRLQAKTGEVSDFIDNELYIVTNDTAKLDAFVARWQGTILASIKPADYGFPEMPNMYLVHVVTDSADTSRLNDHLVSLEPNGAHGEFKLSSSRGHRLLTAAAKEAAEFGTSVGVSWVGEPASLVQRVTTDAPIGVTFDYTPNAFQWPHFAVDPADPDDNQQIGVAEAMLALRNAGRLDDPKHTIAVFDNGFSANEDWPNHQPFPNFGIPFGLPTPWPGKEWHGTGVVQAASAIPDNGYGAAGPGGLVTDIYAVPTTYDPFVTIAGLLAVHAAGVRLVNMSFHMPVPLILNFSVLPYDVVTRLVHEDGTLIFASAGNEGRDIDAEIDLLFGSVETFWYTPAENAGVTAVGGLRYNLKEMSSETNYGREDVDIFAPFYVYSAPIDPDDNENYATLLAGTSFSSPFVAGVAAMIWAAGPRLSGDEVHAILMQTSHRVPGLRSLGESYVNALGAVSRVLGDTRPGIEIARPADGDRFIRITDFVSFEAFAADVEGPVTIEWFSSLNGRIGAGTTFSHTGLHLGTHVITAVATDSAGQTTTATVTIEITTTNPVLIVTTPSNDATLEAGEIQFTALVEDNDHPGGFPGELLRWAYRALGDTDWIHFAQSGLNVLQTFAPGTYEIRAVAIDGFGGLAVEFFTINVVPFSSVGKPTARILSPEEGARFFGDHWVDVNLRAIAEDEGEVLTGDALRWTTDRADLQADGQTLLGTGTDLWVRLYTGGWHTITLIVTDRDGNVVRLTRTVLASRFI